MTSPSDPGLVSTLQAIDARVYRLERAMVVVVITVMTAAIALAVLWRVFSESEGRIEAALVSALGDTAAIRGTTRALTFALIAALGGFAARTARRDWGVGRCLAVGTAVAGLLYAAGFGLVYLLPFGLVFSQRLALALLMWMVFLGSSMAAYRRRHIVVQAAFKLVPDHLKATHASVSLLLAAGFTGFLWWASTRYMMGNFARWLESDFRESRFDSIAIPYWAVTLAVTIGLGLTMVRFVFQALLIYRGLLPAQPISEEDEALAGAQETAEDPATTETSS
ncbi:MAG: TRAP transporter small permease subunit [Myxococcota bacterium]